MRSSIRPEYLVGGVLLCGLMGSALILGLEARDPASAAPRYTYGVTKPYVEIVNPSGFLNTEPITMRELVGKKVILVDFMTYSCINCQRTFPYLVSWYEKYKDRGLEIIGIHTPEFAFEKDIENVRRAMETYGITYPVVLDNDYATWRAYGNRYWPRKYLVDIHGNIVYDHIGEGAYEETERMIVELLEERARVLGEEAPETETLVAEMLPERTLSDHSPEVYFGAERNDRLGNGPRGIAGMRSFAVPERIVRDTLYLGGTWNVRDEYAEAVGDAKIVFRYTGSDVFMVAESDRGTDIEIRQDGMRVYSAGGEDVRDGIVRVRESRLYKLIHNPEPGEHVLELIIRGGGVRVYTFTFG